MMHLQEYCISSDYLTSNNSDLAEYILSYPYRDADPDIKMVRVAIIYYSTWGHVATMAQAEKKGIEAAGGTADLFQ